MNDFVDSFAYWLADYYLATTLLLVAALVAIRVCSQPVKRLVVAKAATVAMCVMAGLCAVPGWSVISLVIIDETRAEGPLVVESIAPVDVKRVAASAVDVAREGIVVAPAGVTTNDSPPVRAPISWPTVVVTMYLAGSAGVLVWLGAGAIAARRLVRRANPAPASLSDLLMNSGGCDAGDLQLLVSDEIDVAVALGVWRPRVLVPTRWVASRPTDELAAVLAHEAAHVENGDLTWLAWSRLLLALLWAQPLYWLLRRTLRLDQEALADAAASDHAGRQQYADQLVAWARDVTSRPRPLLPAAMGLWEGPSQLRRRVALLLDERLTMLRRCPQMWMLSATGLIVALAALLSITTLEPLNVARGGQDRSDSDSAQEQSDVPAVAPKAEAVADDELAGVAQDGKGQPLAGVTVDAWTWFPGNETVTDDAGRFSLKGFDIREPVELQFTKPGFCPRLFIAQPVGEANWVVTLNDRSFLEGRVLDPNDERVAGINIRATRGPFAPSDGSRIDAVWTETESDADGRYRMYLEPDTYELRVRQPGVGVARYEKTVVRENDHREFDLQLKAGPTFRARVIDSQTDEPVAGIRLFQWREAGIAGSSNEDGELEIVNMLPGPYEFNVSADGEKSKFSEVAGAYARWWSPNALKQWQRRELDDGRDRPQQNFGFQRNFDDLEFDIREGMSAVPIFVERCVKIRGRVVDPEGNPVVGATVSPAKTGSGNSLTGDTRYSVRTAADGTFEMRLPASGAAKYNLVAHDGDYEQWRTWANGIGELLQTKPGDVIENVKLQLSRPCIVRGRVQDANGKPVAKHRVQAQASDKRGNRYYDPTSETNERGEFELRFVRPGKHYVQAEPFWMAAEDGPKGAWQLVVAQPEHPTDGVILTLPPVTAESRSRFQMHVVLPPQSGDE